MSTQFFSSLSQNFIEILKDDDITMSLSKLEKTLIGMLAHIKLSNISPEIFQIILKYIYGGIISLNEQEPSETLKILSAADELHLQELVDYLQKYLIENKIEWMEQHFGLVYQTGIQRNSLLELQNFCTNYMTKSPHKVFKSFDFISLSEKSLVSLIKRDDLQMKEVEVWDHVLKWGLEKNHTLLSDPTTWSDDDFKMMETLISRWIDKIDVNMKGTEEIIGGCNPSVWKSVGDYSKAKDSFVFTFKSKDNFKDSILSYIKDHNKALYFCSNYGPTFDDDLDIYVEDGYDNKNYNFIRCKQKSYEKKIKRYRRHLFDR
ncbi:unnamed protein product [Rhizophagus irregularis]|nr:unnamed protein product [Rhizophagus irregularis]